MKRLLAINPLISDFAAYDLWAYPIGFLLLLSYLEKKNFHIDYLDCRDRYHPGITDFYPPKNKKFHTGPYTKQLIQKPDVYKKIERPYYLYGFPEKIMLQELKKFQEPDIILITSMMTYWYPGIDYTIKCIRKVFKKTPIILGGMYSNLCHTHSMKRPEIFMSINWKKLHYFFDFLGKGTVEEFMTDLESLTPAYHLYKKLPAISWMTSLGCPFECEICASHFLYKKIRFFHPEKNAENLIHLIKKKRIKDIAFADDALLINSENHFQVWIKRIMGSGIKVNFHTPNGLHLKYLSLENSKLMKKNNFQTIRLSLESSIPNTQQQMDNKTSNSDFDRAVENLLQSGFKNRQLETYILMGLPGQSFQEVLESIFFVFRKNIKVIPASYSPIPHTKLYKKTFPEDEDPLLQNNSYQYHYLDNTPFKKIRELISLFNYGIEHNFNPFTDSFIQRYVEITLKNL